LHLVEEAITEGFFFFTVSDLCLKSSLASVERSSIETMDLEPILHIEAANMLT
jgi:hypothetical protein